MPPIIANAGDLLARYDVLFCDIWGVVHNGQTAYVEGCAALKQFRDNGGTVVLVSNAPRTPKIVAKILAEKHVPEDCWDAIVSSGGIAIAHAAERGFTRVHHIGPDRDLDVFDGSGLERVSLADAEAIFCTGLQHDRREIGEDYRARLTAPAARSLPLICANPDLIVDVGDVQLPCAGAIAVVYESLDAPVYWAGKPHATAYGAAIKHAAQLRGTSIDKTRVLAIGDAVRTDIAGAVAFGIDALFIAQGIHRKEVAPNGTIDPAALASIFASDAPQAIAAMMSLRW
ncbi:MAG: HAD superfamily hydrolase (TIGR01459 family) [Hyphomicrobiaceae bacterium]|jgi:HAD superfamily hydrolase (TIGR01459 family)